MVTWEKNVCSSEKRKIQNKIRKNEAINSKVSKHQTITVEEQEKIKYRQEQNKQNSRRYKDKKRTTNFINL